MALYKPKTSASPAKSQLSPVKYMPPFQAGRLSAPSPLLKSGRDLTPSRKSRRSSEELSRPIAADSLSPSQFSGSRPVSSMRSSESDGANAEYRFIMAGGVKKMVVVPRNKDREMKLWNRIKQEWEPVGSDPKSGSLKRKQKQERALKAVTGGAAALVGFSTLMYERSADRLDNLQKKEFAETARRGEHDEANITDAQLLQSFVPPEKTASGYPKCFHDVTYTTCNQDKDIIGPRVDYNNLTASQKYDMDTRHGRTLQEFAEYVEACRKQRIPVFPPPGGKNFF